MKKLSKVLLFTAGAALGTAVVAKCMTKKCCCGCCSEEEMDETSESAETSNIPVETTEIKSGKRHYVSIPVSMEKLKEDFGSAIDSMRAKMDKVKKAAEDKAETMADAAEELLDNVADTIEEKVDDMEENIETKFEEVMSASEETNPDEKTDKK